MQALLTTLGVQARADLQQEVEEALSLFSKQLEIQIGVPLVLLQVPGGSLGPGCVVWDCGVLLAWYLHQLSQATGGGGTEAGDTTQSCSAHACSTQSGSTQAAGSTHEGGAQASSTGAGGAQAGGTTTTDHSCVTAATYQTGSVEAQQEAARRLQLRGAHVLELGSGTGVVGLAAAAQRAHVRIQTAYIPYTETCMNAVQ